MQLAVLISKLRVQMGKTISMRALHQNSRFVDFVAYLSEFTEGTVATHQSERWMQDSHLADALEPLPEWLSENEGRVFMTGTTGFVGVDFLRRFLDHPSVKGIVCLVREKKQYQSSAPSADCPSDIICGMSRSLTRPS